MTPTSQPAEQRYYRRVIRITAEDSPNVRLALAQIARNLPPTGQEILAGVLGWEEYQKRRATWDIVKQTVGLDARFYEGAQVLLYPPEWLDNSATIAASLGGVRRRAKGIGIDPAQGGDYTAMAAVDELGLIELQSRKTPDTTRVVDEAIAFMIRHKVDDARVVFDAGGGGKQHADIMRRKGYGRVRIVAFGEAVTLEPRQGAQPLRDRRNTREERAAYFNRRSQMYGELRELLAPQTAEPDSAYDPDPERARIRRRRERRRLLKERLIAEEQERQRQLNGHSGHREADNGDTEEHHTAGTNGPHNGQGRSATGPPMEHRQQGQAVGHKQVFAIPAVYVKLRQQMAPIPLIYDAERRLKLPKKRKTNSRSTEITLEELIGYSPDELDALVLAVHAMLHSGQRGKVRTVRMAAGARQ